MKKANVPKFFLIDFSHETGGAEGIKQNIINIDDIARIDFECPNSMAYLNSECYDMGDECLNAGTIWMKTTEPIFCPCEKVKELRNLLRDLIK